MKSSVKRLKPDLSLEQGFPGKVCGLDEVGRGPLAGPVVAACVYIPPEQYKLAQKSGITDSKKLSFPALEEFDQLVRENFVFAVAEVSPQVIDEINILQASLLAMKTAFESLKAECFAHALVDGNFCPDLPCAAMPVIGGDGRSLSIAAASVIAKVYRDRLMHALCVEWPHYGWETNAGYGTRAHLEAIDRHGITPHHRRSFEPVRNFIAFGATTRQSALAL